jgi:hypothetical protein
MKLYILIYLFVVLSGCATIELGDKFQSLKSTPKDKATLYIYRPKTYFNWAGWPDVYIDNKKIAPLVNNSYFISYVMPGEHKIKAKGSTWGTNWYPGPMERNFTFSAGLSYYLRIRPFRTDSPEFQNLIPTLMASRTISPVILPLSWPSSITLIEMVKEDIGKIEIQETHQLKSIK